MKGSYHFRVKSKRALFDFTLRRNITVIKGDSATGKTTLLHMLYEYLRTGRESGYSVSTDAAYYVYLRQEVGMRWQEIFPRLKDTIIFIEENNTFVFSQEFAAFVRDSGNYFVLVTRAPLKMLPYSIHEIYEILTAGKRADIKESYHYFREMYSNYPVVENNRIACAITEDSNAGFQFFAHVLKDSKLISAGGNGNVLSCLEQTDSADTLAIVDGAAFGAMIESCLEYIKVQTNRRIALWMPESFEYLILKSGVLTSRELEDILASPWNYVEAKESESWERFFTQLLISLAKDTPFQYSKQTLNPSYLQDRTVRKIVDGFPAAIKNRLFDFQA